MASEARPRRWILGSLALQNLGRRGTRTTLLMAAVAIACAIAFAGAVMTRSIQTSLEVGFSRLGADLMVVNEAALTNITAALLTVEPTDTVLDADTLTRMRIAGVGRVAAQRVFRTDASGVGGHGDSLDLIGFDPQADFTVRPWIAERLGRPMTGDDVVVGSARTLPLGSELVLFGKRFRVYAKLQATGAGTHERGIFLQMPALLALAPAIKAQTGALPAMLDPAKVSGFLVELAPGATELQVRFALLSQRSGIKVVSGSSLLTGIRQGLTALVSGTLALVGLMFFSIAVMVSVLFSAIVAERRRELGLMKAIGARRSQIVGTLTLEAMIATGGGGVIGIVVGVLLLRLFERSLVYHLTQIGVPFLWLDRAAEIAVGAVCLAAALLIGAIGALVPAWRASRQDPYDLIRVEN
jgi:putative ABC transport system permease protein